MTAVQSAVMVMMVTHSAAIRRTKTATALNERTRLVAPFHALQKAGEFEASTQFFTGPCAEQSGLGVRWRPPEAATSEWVLVAQPFPAPTSLLGLHI